VIILDTNQLLANRSLQTPGIHLLQAVSQAMGEQLVIPEVVRDEYLAHYEHDLQEACDKAKAAYAEVERLAPEWTRSVTLAFSFVQDALKARRGLLERLFRVEPVSELSLRRAQEREIHRLPPASTHWAKGKPGYGARDAAIWLTTLGVAAGSGRRCYFVSNDGAAFGNPHLHQALATESTSRGVELVYCVSLDDLFTKLGSMENLATADAQIRLTAPIVTAAVHPWLTTGWPYVDLIFAVTGSGPGTVDVVGEPSYEPRAIECGSREFQAGDQSWAILESRWIVNATVVRTGEDLTETWRVELSVPVALLVEYVDGAAIQAQVLSVQRGLPIQSYLETATVVEPGT
jgi:hypothetical protein